MNQVYWVPSAPMSVEDSVVQKLERLLSASGALEGLAEGMRVALKINTSEEGYEYGLRPVFLRAIAEAVRGRVGAGALLCDGLKLVDYRRRTKGSSFMEVARSRGYIDHALGGSLVINGGFSGDEGNLYRCPRPGSELGGVEVGAAVCRSDALLVLSHVTLHPLFGLSGALVNGGFECLVGRERLRVLDGIDPYLFNGHRPEAGSIARLHRRALEGHLGVRESVNGGIFYLNYVWDVTPQPEHFPFSLGPVVQNLGFLASRDPVALDQATHALLADSLGPDVSSLRIMTGVDFPGFLALAEELGLGSRRHTLTRL
ncbi:MAG: DUF362 domain-containing protein [Deltaproteobacteria bacterium]|nr:DUF362 domain-containing protein [Deltaproteobacteria bacterium]